MHGKILDESSSLYHSHQAVSHSKLEVFRKRPLLFKKRFIDRTVEAETSPAFAIGSALHCAVLEPSEYEHRYAIRPDGMDRRTKEGKAQYEAFAAGAEGKEIISMDDARLVSKMAEAVRAHPAAKELLAKGEPEVTWRSAYEGLPDGVQCRTDWFRPGYVADVKTIDSLDGNSFIRNVVNFGYHRQFGFYSEVLRRCGHSDLKYFFVVVEKKEPFGVIVYEATPNMLAKGYRESLEDLNGLKECFRSDYWPNMPTMVQDLELPAWYKGGAE